MRDITESKPPDWIGAIRSGPPWIQAEGADGQIVRLFPNDQQIKQIHGVFSEYLTAADKPVEVEPVAEWPKYFSNHGGNYYWVYVSESEGFTYNPIYDVWKKAKRALNEAPANCVPMAPDAFAALGLPPIPTE